MGTVTETLRLILQDDVSSGAKKAESALEKLAVDAKALEKVLAESGASTKFGDQLKRIGASTDQVKAAAGAWEQYAKAQGLAGERANWTKEQSASVRAWESQTVSGVRAVMNVEKVLESERAQAHASRMRQIQAEEIKTAASVKRAAEMQHREQERIIEQRAHGQEHHGIRNFALQSAAMAVSAHAIVHGIEAVLEHGAEYQHKLVAMQNTGRTPEEVAEMGRASHSAIRGVPTATLTENLEILTETVGAFGSVEHAMEHLPFMNKAAAILHSVAGDKISDSAGAMGNKFARFFEMRGTAGNGELFEHEASEMMKSMVFSGGNINPTELLNFAQQAKSALQNYDLHFLSRVAPSLIGEVGGDRAGTQANAFNSVLLGKVNDKKQAEAWLKYGLVDEKQMVMKAGHAVGWNGGAVHHTDEFLQNPLAAGEKYVLPALQAKGVDINNQLELTKALGTLFRNQNANAFANELWQRQNIARLHKDDPLIGKVETPDAMYKRLLTTDPTFALVALKASLGNFLTTLSSPVMGTAAQSMSGFAENLNSLALIAHDNPAAAVTAGIATAAGSLYAAGKLSYGLLNGFGNAAFGAAAGEMAMAGHEQLAAARIMVGAAEVSRAGAIGHEIPGVVPGGKLGAVVREGEALAKGALTVEALEIATSAGVTLTAGTVALVGVTAAAIMAALVASTPKKHQASDDPNFGNPFAPGKGVDFNDPHLQEKADDAKKPSLDRNGGAHPRGAGGAYDPTSQPGEWVKGPHGTSHYVQHDLRGPKVAPYFSTAPLDEQGHVKGMLHGWMGDRVPVDPSTGSIFGLGNMPTDPRLYQPADVPLPPVRPGTGIERRTFGAYLDYARPEAATGTMPAATPPAAPPSVTPTVDPSAAEQGLMHLTSLSSEAGQKMQADLNVSASPTVNLGSIQAYVALLERAIGLQSQLGAVSPGANASVGARRSMQPAPAGPRLSV